MSIKSDWSLIELHWPFAITCNEWENVCENYHNTRNIRNRKNFFHVITELLLVFIFLFISLRTRVECSIWNEESSHSKSNQNQELEEPETGENTVTLEWDIMQDFLDKVKLLCKKGIFHI